MLMPGSFAGTPLLGRSQEAVEAGRRAVEAMSGAAWIDVDWQISAVSGPMVDRMVVRADEGAGHAEAPTRVVEMIAKRVIEL